MIENQRHKKENQSVFPDPTGPEHHGNEKKEDRCHGSLMTFKYCCEQAVEEISAPESQEGKPDYIGIILPPGEDIE